MSSFVYTEVQRVLDLKSLIKEGGTDTYFSYQFDKLLKTQGLNKESLTMEDLREAVGNLLQDVLLELKNELEEK